MSLRIVQISTLLVALSSLLFIMAAPARAETIDQLIHVVRNSSMQHIEIDGTKAGTSPLRKEDRTVIVEKGTVNTWTGDLDPSTIGFERIKKSGRKLAVSLQDGDIITRIKASSNIKNMFVTVGDILPDVDGDEIIICDHRVRKPRLKIFSYDAEAQELTKKRGMLPFTDVSDNPTDSGGCENLAIADVDGDGVNEIVTAKRRYSPTQSNRDYGFVTLSRTGAILSTTDLGYDAGSGGRYSDETENRLLVADMDGDDSATEIFLGSNRQGPTVRSLDGDLLFSEDSNNWPSYIHDWGVYDVDGDGKDELVILSGKKGYVRIFDENFDIETQFKLYPNRMKKRIRNLRLGDVSTFLDDIL